MATGRTLQDVELGAHKEGIVDGGVTYLRRSCRLLLFRDFLKHPNPFSRSTQWCQRLRCQPSREVNEIARNAQPKLYRCQCVIDRLKFAVKAIVSLIRTMDDSVIDEVVLVNIETTLNRDVATHHSFFFVANETAKWPIPIEGKALTGIVVSTVENHLIALHQLKCCNRSLIIKIRR
jgi:hypothetical protein